MSAEGFWATGIDVNAGTVRGYDPRGGDGAVGVGGAELEYEAAVFQGGVKAEDDGEGGVGVGGDCGAREFDDVVADTAGGADHRAVDCLGTWREGVSTEEDSQAD